MLIAALVQDFCAMFTPGGRVLYIGDADKKLAVSMNPAWRPSE